MGFKDYVKEYRLSTDKWSLVMSPNALNSYKHRECLLRLIGFVDFNLLFDTSLTTYRVKTMASREMEEERLGRRNTNGLLLLLREVMSGHSSH